MTADASGAAPDGGATGTASGPSPLRGIGVGRGAVVGPVLVLSPVPVLPADEPAPADVAAAQQRIDTVLAEITGELQARAAASDGALSDVLRATAQMAADPALAASAHANVAAGIGPATAVDRAIEEFATMFRSAGGYLAERVTDLLSVRHRAVARLLGLPEPGAGELTRPSVIVAEDLSPADTSALDISFVLAIVTVTGSPTSHTAIIAGQFGLPCVVAAAGATDIAPGTVVGVDAAAGTVTLEPSDELAQTYHERAAELRHLDEDTAPGATSDGHRIQILANIGSADDAAKVVDTAIEGVGLFRTELLYLDQQTAPSVAAQTDAYEEVLQHLDGRKVVVRTLDAGADKPLAFAHQATEENPALGVRGFRLIRTLPDLITGQLEALAAAQERTGAALQVMAPMIATPAEAKQFATLARAAGLATVGVMIEVPAAALRAHQILEHVDFVSLGTNDLAQYTMASDRLDSTLADLLDRWQPGVLDLVAATARAGVAAGKPVGVCGESAADPLMALVLCGWGITSLSMSSGAASAVRFALRHHTLEQCEAMAQAALAAQNAAGARAAVLALTDPQVVETLALI